MTALRDVRQLGMAAAAADTGSTAGSGPATQVPSPAGTGQAAASIEETGHPGPPDSASGGSAACPSSVDGAVCSEPVPSPSEGFEGPEKTIEMDFAGIEPGTPGLRALGMDELSTWLTAAKCTILSHHAGVGFDSYVLSESSMFVYPTKVIMKTCGTTTLLRAVPEILRSARECVGATLGWFGYTRKDFLFPEAQLSPHRSVNEEISFLRRTFPEGEAHMLGPLTGDHWVVFVADYSARHPMAAAESQEMTVNLMMYDLHPQVAKHFFESDATPASVPPEGEGEGESSIVKTDATVASGAEQWTAATRHSGIGELLPGSFIQDWMFSPCGYSMNGILFDSYWTIHITPESHCSYASFETNLTQASYKSLLKAVLGVFRPQRYTMTVFADAPALAKLRESPMYPELTPVWPTAMLTEQRPPASQYVCTSQCSTEFMGDYCAALANYVCVDAQAVDAAAPAAAAALAPKLTPAEQLQMPLRIGVSRLSDDDERSSLSSSSASGSRALSGRTPAGACSSPLHMLKPEFKARQTRGRPRLLSM